MGNNEITVTLTAEAVEMLLKLLVGRIGELEYSEAWLQKRLDEAKKQKEEEE